MIHLYLQMIGHSLQKYDAAIVEAKQNRQKHDRNQQHNGIRLTKTWCREPMAWHSLCQLMACWNERELWQLFRLVFTLGDQRKNKLTCSPYLFILLLFKILWIQCNSRYRAMLHNTRKGKIQKVSALCRGISGLNISQTLVVTSL